METSACPSPRSHLGLSFALAFVVLAAAPSKGSEVHFASGVFRPLGTPTVITVSLARTPGRHGELKAATVDWSVDTASARLLRFASGRVSFGRGQATATLDIQVAPGAVDAPRRFGQVSLVRARGSHLGIPSTAALEIGGTALDEEVSLGDGERPAVALTTDGEAIVAWESAGRLRLGHFDAQGHLLRPGGEPVIQRDASCCPLEGRPFPTADGGYWLAWTDRDGDRRGIFAAHFDGEDRRLGPDIQLNDQDELEQLSPRLDFAPDGSFLATFTQTDNVAAIPYIGAPLAARVLAADGSPRGLQHYVAGTHVIAALPLVSGGWLLATDRYERLLGIHHTFQTLAADGTPGTIQVLPGGQVIYEVAAIDDGFVALGCVDGLTVLRDLTVEGELLPGSRLYGDGTVACGEPAALGAEPRHRLGQRDDGAVSLGRASADFSHWVWLPLARLECLNAGLCEWGRHWQGASEPGRDTVLVWDGSDGVWMRRFPAALRGMVLPAVSGPRTAPGETVELRLGLAGEGLSTQLAYATLAQSALANRDFRPAAGRLTLTAPGEPTPIQVEILDPAGETRDRSLVLSLSTDDPSIGIATPKRPPIFIIRNTVCNQLGPALCFLGRTVEIGARWSHNGSETFSATPHQLDDRTGYLTYDDPSRPELAVKILGTRQQPTLYWASLSATATDLVIGDDIDGRYGYFGSEFGDDTPCGGGVEHDPYLRQSAPQARLGNAGPCVPGTGELCLLAGRFAVSGRWHNPWNDADGPLLLTSINDAAGRASYDGQLLEALIRMEQTPDGVLFAVGPLSDFGLTFDVRDTLSGATRTFTRPERTTCRIWEPTAF